MSNFLQVPPAMQVVETGVAVVPQAYQVLKIEPVVGEIIGGGTSAVLLRGSDVELPAGALLVAPSGSSTAA